MASNLNRMDSGDQETLYSSYQCPYYVQSPSTISHANSATDSKSTHLEHSSTLMFLHYSSPTDTRAASRPALSRCSSSYGSTNSLLNERKLLGILGGDDQASEDNVKKGVNRLVIVEDNGKGSSGDHHHNGTGYEEEEEWELDEDEEREYVYYWWKWWWWRYCSFRRSPSLGWFCLQLGWRFLFSFGVALLVFYLATKPPPPKVSIKVAGVPEFELAEGVDTRGVTTKILTFNCSMNLLIDNKSKVFGLHIHPPTLKMSFGRLHFAISRESRLYADANGLSSFQLFVGARDKPMYGAGRNMEDMLDSGKGLPIIVEVKLSSNFRVVWNLINPKFHHQAHCFLVLEKSYDKEQRTQFFHSSCSMIS